MNKSKILAFINKLFGSNFKLGEEITPTEEQNTLLQAAFPDNEETPGKIIAFLNEKEEDNDAIKAEIIAHLATQTPTELAAEGDNSEDGKKAKTNEPETVAEAAQALIEQNKILAEANKILMEQPEPDVPLQIVGKNKNQMNIPKHTTVALFGSDEPHMAFEGRNWNTNIKNVMENGMSAYKATTFTTIDIQKINDDFGDYHRKFQDGIKDYFRDFLRIPSNWMVISDVSDLLTTINIVLGEVTQGYKKGFRPKGSHKFAPVTNKIYDFQIDILLEGSELKKLEKSFMKEVVSIAQYGSNPDKRSFIQYLWRKMIERARFEDKIGFVKGVFFDNNRLEAPGRAINALNGYIHKVKSQMYKTFIPFDLPETTRANIYDQWEYIKDIFPQMYKNVPLQINYSPEMIEWYRDAYSDVHGTKTDEFAKVPMNHIKGRSNWKFVPLEQLDGTTFFTITFEDNIGVMVDKIGEENKLQIQQFERDFKIFGDYKLGPAVGYFGEEVKDPKSKDYSKQVFWSNNPKGLLEDTAIPQEPNAETLDVKNHNVIVLGAQNTAPTNVTAITNATVGVIYIFKGDAETNKSTIKAGGNLLLNSDFVATPTSELYLLARSDGKFVEVDRKDLTASKTIVTIAADATTVDANLGDEFITQDNTQATAITDITNAISGETYTIKGGSDTNATTIANGGNFTLASTMTLNVGKFIELYYNGSKFIEVKRG